jgi:hypothetical protein
MKRVERENKDIKWRKTKKSSRSHCGKLYTIIFSTLSSLTFSFYITE